MRRLRALFVASLPLVLVLGAWQLYCGSSARRAFFFSTPLAIVQSALKDLQNGSLLRNLVYTGAEALCGFILGNFAGIVVGLMLWYSQSIARVSKPYLIALGSTPIFALAPMTIIWFGVGFGAKVALAFLGTFFIALMQAFRGAEQVDPLHLRRFRVFGATNSQIFRWLLIPSSAIWVVGALRLTIGGALLGAFIGEFIAADRGLGYMIVKAAGLYDTARVLVGVLTIVGLAIAMDKAVDRVENAALAWRPRVGRD